LPIVVFACSLAPSLGSVLLTFLLVLFCLFSLGPTIVDENNTYCCDTSPITIDFCSSLFLLLALLAFCIAPFVVAYKVYSLVCYIPFSFLPLFISIDPFFLRATTKEAYILDGV
jgi:hypothetical protein